MEDVIKEGHNDFSICKLAVNAFSLDYWKKEKVRAQ